MIAAVLMHLDAASVVGLVGTARKNMNDNIGRPLTVLGYDRWVRGIELAQNIARTVGRQIGIPDHVIAAALR